MLTNDEIKNIPIETFITPDVTLIAIWCTNAPSLTHTVLNEFLPKWKLKLIATWHWLKVISCYWFFFQYKLIKNFVGFLGQ